MAWHRAAKFGSLEALEKLLSWAKELELKTHQCLLSQTGDGYTVFQLAAESNHVGIMKLLSVFDRRSADES